MQRLRLAQGFLIFSQIATVIAAWFVLSGDLTRAIAAHVPALNEVWVKLLTGILGAGVGLLVYWLIQPRRQ